MSNGPEAGITHDEAPGNRADRIQEIPDANRESLYKNKRWTLILMILLITFLFFAITLGFKFVFDDRSQITDNYWIRSWEYLPKFFTSYVWAFDQPKGVSNYYRAVYPARRETASTLEQDGSFYYFSVFSFFRGGTLSERGA